MFNAQSCSSCHLLDGRGNAGRRPARASSGCCCGCRSRAPTSTGRRSTHPVYGGQLQDRANVGVPIEGELVISYTEQPGEYADGTQYSLRVPTYSIEAPAFGPLGDDLLVSPRLAPQVIGMGLLEAVPESTIVAARRSRRRRRRRHLRSGQPGLEPADAGRPSSGRFGWKANVPSVEAQVAGAFHGDIGITSALHPDQDCTATADRRARRRSTAANPSSPTIAWQRSPSTRGRWRCRRCATPTIRRRRRTAPAAFERARVRQLPHTDADDR